MQPTVQQVRREWDRRCSPNRKYTRCRTLRHIWIQWRLRSWRLEDLRSFVMYRKARIDVPSPLIDPCVCGGLKPVNKWG